MSELGHWVWTYTLGEHTLSFNLDTIFTMWLAMLILIVFAFIATRNLEIVPSKLQAVCETVMNMISGTMNSFLPEKGAKHVPLVASLFLFILTANLIGQIPLRVIHLKSGELAAPTNDINVTAGLAIIVLVYYVGLGLMTKKEKFLLHEISISGFIMMFVEILEMITRPLSLAIRLFANILAGEILVTMMLGIFAYFLPIPIMLFELLVAFIQATVFMMLTMTYIASAEGEH